MLVQFSTADHFRTDYVNFLVADFDMAYHAILGRPALAKFMVIPHYVYLVLKMPMEKGILTLRANLNTTYACERESLVLAKATDISICMPDCLVTSQQMPPEEQEILTKEAPRAATKSKEVKDVVLVPSDWSKTTRIEAPSRL